MSCSRWRARWSGETPALLSTLSTRVQSCQSLNMIHQLSFFDRCVSLCFTSVIVASQFAAAADTAGFDLEKRVTHGYATNNGVRIHYASLGQGPLLVMIHGFPDYWFTWRQQMESLSKDFQTVAIDLRGYNLSDKPKGAENYDMNLLVEDVTAVVRH